MLGPERRAESGEGRAKGQAKGTPGFYGRLHRAAAANAIFPDKQRLPSGGHDRRRRCRRRRGRSGAEYGATVEPSRSKQLADFEGVILEETLLSRFVLHSQTFHTYLSTYFPLFLLFVLFMKMVVNGLKYSKKYTVKINLYLKNKNIPIPRIHGKN